MNERLLAIVLALTFAARAWANGGGVILTPPADFTLIATDSVKVFLEGVHVKHVAAEGEEVWVASPDRGLGHWKGGRAGFSWARQGNGGLPKDGPTRVARFRGETWVGFATGGVARVDEKSGQAFDVPGDELVDLVPHGGRLWALSSKGLFVLEGSKFIPAPVAGEAPRGVVTAVSSGFDGKLYVGTDQTDVGVWDGAAWKRYAFADRVVGRVIRCVSVGVGHIWFGTFGSLNDYTPETGRLDDETVEKAVLFPSRIMVALAGNADLMLTVTSGGGLYRFDRPASWRLYSDTNGLPSISIEGVSLAYPIAWVATANGIARIDLSRPLPGLPPAPRPSAAPTVAAPTKLTGAIPPARTPLGATGRTLLEVPSLLSKGLTCLTCHKDGWSNPAFTSPTGGPGTVDLTSAWANPEQEDSTSNARKIPHLYGLRWRGPYPSGGGTASLREYLRAHIVRDLAGPEPSAQSLDALEVYLGEVEVPRPPALREDGQLRTHASAAARRGELVFRRTFDTLGARSCASCHDPATRYTDNRLHLRREGHHARTPTLLGLNRNGPYLSDGSRRTVPDVVTYYNDTYHLQLKRADVEDLAAYLATVGEVGAP